MSSVLNQKVFITPLIKRDTYGDEIEVTEYVKKSGIGLIKRGLDDTEFTFGLYAFGEVKLTLNNDSGLFNDESDSRSMFKYRRDRAKVRIVYENIDLERKSDGSIADSESDDEIVFRGLLTNDGVRQSGLGATIEMRVLSRDSILRKAIVPSGSVPNLLPASEVIFNILNNEVVESLLGVSASNIDVGFDFIVDFGDGLSNKTVFQAMKELLIASNAVMYVNDDDEIIVTGREEDDDLDTLFLFGPYEPLSRDNIINVLNDNDGTQRMFNSVTVNQNNRTNEAYADFFGLRSIDFTFDWCTDDETAGDIASNLVAEFKMPRRELTLAVPYEIGKSAQLFQPVSVDWPLRVLSFSEDHHLPVVGSTKIEDAVEVLPKIFGNFTVHKSEKYKIIAIEQDPKTFSTNIKIRMTGTTLGQGAF